MALCGGGVQVNHLTKHVQQNPKDFSSRRGLITAVNQRRRCVTTVSPSPQIIIPPHVLYPHCRLFRSLYHAL